jgi:hypothetical protein
MAGSIDADAVQWTYHDFRNAYPETNTEAAMDQRSRCALAEIGADR